MRLALSPLRECHERTRFFTNMIATQPLPPAPAAHTQAASPLTNPNLSAALRLEYDALVNDMRRAQELCVEFQRQLEGKSLEVDEFKELFSKTQSDLFQLQDSITELREERHRLANEAMRATALSRKLVEVTQERDRLLAEIAFSKTAPTVPPPVVWKPGDGAGAETVVGEMWRTLARLQTIFDSDVAVKVPPAPAAKPVGAASLKGRLARGESSPP